MVQANTRDALRSCPVVDSRGIENSEDDENIPF
jgi:hypothetical protein